jgi:hypothetical protein
MDNSIIFLNGLNKARFPGGLGKSIVEGKEAEKVVGDEDKQDNALKASMSLFSSLSQRLIRIGINTLLNIRKGE